MSKGFLKFIVAIIIAIIFIYAFSASYSTNNIDSIAYVIALGIDQGEDENTVQVTFEFIDSSTFSSDGSSESSSPILDTVTSTSINSAINLLNNYLGKEVNMAHCKVIVISTELAENGIESEMTELMNNIQVRPTANLVISKCSATEYIQNSYSSLEKVLTKYYDIFPNSSEYTGYTSNVMIGEFYETLTEKNSGNIAILGGLNEASVSSESSSESSSSDSASSGNASSDSTSSDNASSESSSTGESTEESSFESSSSDSSENSSSENESTEENSNSNNISLSSIYAGNSPISGERGTENIGLAVFNGDKYIGELSAMDTLCHSIISGEVNSFLFTLDNPEIYENYVDINLFENTEPQISIDVSSDIPIINIEIRLTGRIVGIKSETDSEDETNLDLEKISDAVNEYLKYYILEYLNKTTNEFKCDLNNFFNYAKCNFLTTQEWKNYDWASKYPNSQFNVTVEADVFYSLLNSE